MIIFQALIAGIIAGLTCFLPVSSLGCVMLFIHYIGFEENFYFYEMILTGLVLASVSFFYKDILRIVVSALGMIRDLCLRSFRSARPEKKGKNYSEDMRILDSNYKYFTLLILLSLIPIAVLSFLAKALFRFAFENELIVCMGFMLTALLLLVSSFMNAGGKSPKKMKTSDAILLGFVEGIALVPGVSKIGTGISTGYFLGLSRKFIMKYIYLIGMISMIFMLIPGGVSFHYVGGEADTGVMAAALIGSLVSGALMIRVAQKQISRTNHKLYALLNIALAMTAACVYLITK